MKQIEMPTRESKNFLEVFEMFVISQAAKGVSDITIRNYRYHMKNMSNYFDAEKPFDEVTKRDIEAMVYPFPNRGIMWLTAPPRVILILGDGFHACSRKHAPKAGRRTATEHHRNCFSTSLASTAFTSHLRQFSAFGICVFSTGRYYRMYSPSLRPISSLIVAAPLAFA